MLVFDFCIEMLKNLHIPSAWRTFAPNTNNNSTFMEQSQFQEQRLEQALKQTATVTQQQLLQAQLMELPMVQLLDRVNIEVDDNPALESQPSDESYESNGTEENDYTDELDERQSDIDEALSRMSDDEELPVYTAGGQQYDEREQTPYGDITSFYDELRSQIAETELTEQEREIMDYLVGSLDSDGLLRKSTDTIADELAIYRNIDVTSQTIEGVLAKLQRFDPAGIGARSLQECLLLQIERRPFSRMTQLMEIVVKTHFDDFMKKRWDRLRESLKLTETQAELVHNELRRLNPKPGAAMGESVGRSLQRITPDFIVDTQDDGTVTFSLNQADMPELQVSQSFVDTLNEYKSNKQNMSRQSKEALLYTKRKVDAAQNFIEALKVRKHTLTVTMKAIIAWQHQFFEDGDETSLRPMILKDIADKTGLGVSTISRVSNSKYVQTRWGVFPLRYFFSDGYVTESGEEMSTRKIKAALRDIVDGEDKSKPLGDDALKEALAAKGFTIARRTVSKYREQLGIPVARLRK